MRVLAIFAWWLILVCQSLAQGDPYDLPIQEHLYENGLRLLVIERPDDHRVACKIFTDFGGLVETPGDLGSAHFLEHLYVQRNPNTRNQGLAGRTSNY